MSIAQTESRLSNQISTYERSPAQLPDALVAPSRPEHKRITLKEVLAYGATLLTVAGLVAGYEKATEPTHIKITEVVQPYDTDWSLADRAEVKAGAHLDAIDVTPIVDQIRAKYGLNPKTGKEITVDAIK